jgi:hypothetical protein
MERPKPNLEMWELLCCMDSRIEDPNLLWGSDWVHSNVVFTKSLDVSWGIFSGTIAGPVALIAIAISFLSHLLNLVSPLNRKLFLDTIYNVLSKAYEQKDVEISSKENTKDGK